MRNESKPLVYFVTAAVVAAIALIFVIGDSMRSVPSVPKMAETGTSATEGTAETAAATPSAEAPAAEQPAQSTATDTTESKPKVPSFDIVRVEEDGAAVIAGQAEPGAEIMLTLDGKTVGTAVANARGEWVVTPNQPLPKGAHNLMIVSKNAQGVMTQSEQMVAVSVPETGAEQPLIVLSQPAEPSKVLQKPDAASETEVAAVDSSQTDTAAQEEQPAATPAPAATQEQPAQEATTGEQPAANGQPAQQPEPEVVEEQPAKQPETKTAAVQPAQQPEPVAVAPLVMDAVDYNDAGNIVFSGRAGPGETVRVYVDNLYTGDAVADALGNWVFRGQGSIKPGVHKLRIDQVGIDGKVVQRRELPFERAEPSKVAELQQSQSGQVAAATPEPAPAPAASEETESQQPAQTAAVETTPAPAQPAQPAVPKVGKVIIQPGNNLWNISRVIYGRGIEYSVIYEANKEQIRNPHRIYPGQIFTTPGVVPPSEIDPKRREPMEQGETATQ